MVLAARILVFSLLLVACGGESAAREATPTAPPAAAVGEGALGSTPPAAPLPEGPIPGWCRIDARWASLTVPVSLEALCDPILRAPPGGAPHTHASLCESAELVYGSPDCPTDGPWLAQSLEGELTLVVAQPGGLYARIPELAWLSDGTEQTTELGRWELAAAHPLDAGSSVTVSELWCLDEDNSEDCGLAESDLIHKVLREVDDRILRVTATIDLRRAPPEAELVSGPPTLEVSGDSFTLSVCGGHGRFPLPTVPVPTSTPTPAPPADPSASRECVVVHLGLDLRALPTNTSPSGVDMFVLHQADELRRATPGAPPRIGHVPGTGVLHAFFDGGRGPAEVARCERALAAYLPTAPRLPVQMEPAVQVTEPCRPCD